MFVSSYTKSVVGLGTVPWCSLWSQARSNDWEKRE